MNLSRAFFGIWKYDLTCFRASGDSDRAIPRWWEPIYYETRSIPKATDVYQKRDP